MKGFTHERGYHNETKEWYTPAYIFDALSTVFDMDVCSPGPDKVPWVPALRHLTIVENGLTTPWEGLVWMNPPYGSDTPAWFERLANHGQGIALVFARTDTKWFHEYIVSARGVCFVKGRIPFIHSEDADAYAKTRKSKGGCGSPSMLVAFGKEALKIIETSGLGVMMYPG